MRLTTKTDYCLRILIYLQQHPGKSKIQIIADDLVVSKNHLSVAANKLSELRYVHSSSGPKGGIEFNTKRKDVSVAKVVNEIEDFEIVECFDPKTNTCTMSSTCKLKHMFSGATKAFLNNLDHYKIKDLI